MKLLLAVVAITVTVLAGCGGNSSSSGGANAAVDLHGNWDGSAQSSVFQGTSVEIAGGITETNGVLGGALHVLNSSCFNISDVLVVSGSVDSSGKFSLTTSADAGQVISITGIGNPQSLSGTYSLTGGCGNGDKGSFTATSYPSISGTYSGSFTSTPSGTTAQIANASVVQAQSPSYDGTFALTGNVSLIGSPCGQGGNIQQSIVLGSYVALGFQNGTDSVLFTGNMDKTGKIITGQYADSGASACNGDYGNGSVSRP